MAIGKIEKTPIRPPVLGTVANPSSKHVDAFHQDENSFTPASTSNAASRLGRNLETTAYPPREEVSRALDAHTPEEIQQSVGALIDEYGVDGVEALLSSEISNRNSAAWGRDLSESYQAVADGALGAKLLARNDTQFVTEKDYAIWFDEGSVNVFEIGDYNARTIRVNGASVEAAHAYAKAQINMATADEGNQFPASHWTPVEGKPGFFKSQLSPSESLKHVLENPKEYKAECATQTVLANYEALRQLWGDEAFNEKFSNGITVGLSFKGTELAPFLVSDDEKARIAGEMAYVQNPAPNREAAMKGHQGQNLILMTSSTTFEKDDFSSWTPGALSTFTYGSGRYRPKDLDSVISSVNGPDNSHIDGVELHRRQAFDRSIPSTAYLAPGRTYINPDILR